MKSKRLAKAIVGEVKLRGPFLSLADFVNRRLAEDETGRMGALQAAIEQAGLNSGLTAAYPLNNQSSLPDYSHPDNIPDATRMEQTLKPASKAWGAPGWLTQADVLQVLGPVLSAPARTPSSSAPTAMPSMPGQGDRPRLVRGGRPAHARTAWIPMKAALNPRLAGARGRFRPPFRHHFVPLVDAGGDLT